MSYCKIWVAGVLVRDLIPVLDWSDVACMYDRVSGALFYNAGEGDFVAGPELIPVLDTVNWRVYRNAGTGAFAYGADVTLDILAN